LKECFELARKAGAKSALASWLGFGAIQFLRYGEAELAQGFCREGLALAHEMGNKRNIADCLEGLAGVACARGRMARAARLLGIQEAVLESIHASVNPGVRDYHDRMGAAARTALGTEAFEAAWAEGRAMSLKDAITFALDETQAS
jgi:hypothetical protein